MCAVLACLFLTHIASKIAVVTTASRAQATTPNSGCTLTNARASAECDNRAGEVYLRNSPGKLSSLDLCKKSCQDAAGCRSITYFKSGWCSHYSTSCVTSKWKSKATALRLIASLDSTTVSDSTPTPNTSHDQHWVHVSDKAECDAGAGEIYRQQSPGKLSDAEQCRKSCESEVGCVSITFFRSGWCSHFSTACTQVKGHTRAVGVWRLVR